MRKLWKDHSLTIVSFVLGVVLLCIAFPFKEGTWFDIIVGIGHALFGGAIMFILFQWFTEKKKPEDD